jgi:hypothetical protein
MENGEALIGAAELEELRRYLDIPARLLWGEGVEESSDKAEGTTVMGAVDTIPITVSLGKSVQIVISAAQ